MNTTQPQQPTKEEQMAWLAVMNKLKEEGYGPEDVHNAILEKQPHVNPGAGGGVLQAAHATLSTPITWGTLLTVVGVAIGVGVFLKLVGMAFNIRIPLIHELPEEPLM